MDDPSVKEQNRTPRNGKHIAAAALLLAAGLAWFFAGRMYKSNAGFFHTVFTVKYSAHVLTYDVAIVSDFLKEHFLHILKLYFTGYLAPAFLLIVPGIVAASYALYLLLGQEDDPFCRAAGKFSSFRHRITALFLLGCISSILVHYFITLDYPLSPDEYAYIFQADLIGNGKLFSPAPTPNRFFYTSNILNGRYWYSKYTIGWPFMMAPFRLLGLSFLVNAMLFGGTLALLYAVSEKLWDEKAALMAVLMAFFSPYFVFMSGTYFPHTATGFFTLLAVYGALKIPDNRGLKYPLITGGAICALHLIRPADGGIVLLGMLPFCLYLSLKKNGADKGKSLRKMGLPLIAGLAAGIGILALVNYCQNGNPLLFAFIKFRSDEGLGMGIFNHTPLKGLWNFFYSCARMAFWAVPFISIGVLLSFFRRNSKGNLILIPSVGFALFYFFYYSLGNIEFGARYYYPAFVLLMPSAAAGICLLGDWVESRRWKALRPVRTVIAAAMVFFVITGVLPSLIPSVTNQYRGNKRLLLSIMNPPGVAGRSLILIRNVPGNQISDFTRNKWDYKNRKNLLAIFLMPSENRKLINEYPDRKAYLAWYNHGNSRFMISPYPEKGMNNALNYNIAGINYRINTMLKERAEKALNTAVKMQPDEGRYVFNLGVFFFENGEYEKGAGLFSKLIKENPRYAGAYYHLARCLGEMGQKEKARNVLKKLINAFPGYYKMKRARNWLKYYSRP